MSARLGEVVASMSNGMPGTQNKEGVGIPVSRIETIAAQKIDFGRIGFIKDYDTSSIERYRLQDGDVLFSHINSPAHLGKTAVFSGSGRLYHGINLLRLVVHREAILPKMFDYYCKSMRLRGEFAMRAQHAVNQSSINQAKLAQFEISLPPLAEQRRIADKLDTVLARVDACRERMARVMPLLKRLRQSIFAVATSGRLSEDWRDGAGISSATWMTTSVDKVADIVDPHPSHRTPPEVADGIPYISIGDLEATGQFNLDGSRKVGLDVLAEHRARYTIKDGDFIFGKIGTLGKPTKLPVGLDYTISANVLLIQPKAEVANAAFLRLVFASPAFMASVVDQSSSTSQAAFGIKKMRGTSIRLPSIAEQSEIVRRVETLFAFADRLEARLTQAQAATDRLTPALLAKAFRGELVPQDPADEPAADLLRRLNSQAQPTKVARRPRAA
ncbi:MAG TPA: restriction endonuclease subunit S [Variovorax sp.]|nr:restriction endonuclease subunit S [Variovorax sp.]